jgi:hypothetical protein
LFNKSFALALVIAAGALIAPEKPEACGPDFPTNMLVRRAEGLSEMWSGSFTDEATHLLPVTDTENAVYTREPADIPAQQQEQELYTAAAASFHAGDDVDAERGFAEVLKLPAARRQRMSLPAAYSLGRAHALDGHRVAAIAAFRQVRTLARAAFVDPDGLAAASLGEEAAVIYANGAGDIVAAIHLYAQQASVDEGGALSLLTVMRDTDARARAQIGRDAVGSRLLALFYYTREDEIGDDDRESWRREVVHSSTTEARGADYAAAAMYRAGDWKRAEQLAAVCKHSPIAMWVQAKLALRGGDRTRAEALLAQVEKSRLNTQTEPATTVRGELGLLALADEHFVEAMTWFAKGHRVVESSYIAERVLTLDEMQQAVVAQAVHRNDPIDVQETDEGPQNIYMTFGDEDADTKPDYLPACSAWELDTNEPSACWPRRLHAMYARRLVREHRFDDALAAFGSFDTNAEHSTTRGDQVQFSSDARSYLMSTKAAAAASGVERAERLFASAQVMRDRGMEIAGTETAPDWRIYDGNYSRGFLCLPSLAGGYKYAETPDDYDDEAEDCVAPTRPDAALVSDAEVTRVRASDPPGSQRFAYRIVASQLAEQAAELVPPRSQAYGALMCWAAKYAKRDQDRFDTMYGKFLRNGAAGAGGDFGSECPEPEFDRARTFDDDQAQRRIENALADQRYEQQRYAWTLDRMKKAAWRRKRYAGVPLALVLTFLAVYVARRARRRRATLGTWGGDSVE